MSRDRAVPPHDRVVEPAPDEPLYRVAGVEPHGWSTVLIEDRSGRFFISSAATGRLLEVRASEAHRMIQDRTYRRWHGDRRWSTLDRLPLVAQVAVRPMTTDDASHVDSIQ